MEERLSGRRGDLMRLGFAARNWLILQMTDESELMTWKIDESSRSPKEIASHVSWSLSAVCAHLSEELGLSLETINQEPEDESTEATVRHSYLIFKELLYTIDDNMLDRWFELPPPAKLREGSVDTILRIIAGYHAIHHGGQIALLVKRAKNALI